MGKQEATGDLARALSEEIARRDQSQREAAEHLGVTQQTLSRWLHRLLIPAAENVPAIARYLHLPIAAVRAMRAGMRRPKMGRDDEILSRLDRLTEAITRLVAAVERLEAGRGDALQSSRQVR